CDLLAPRPSGLYAHRRLRRGEGRGANKDPAAAFAALRDHRALARASASRAKDCAAGADKGRAELERRLVIGADARRLPGRVAPRCVAAAQSALRPSESAVRPCRAAILGSSAKWREGGSSAGGMHLHPLTTSP